MFSLQVIVEHQIAVMVQDLDETFTGGHKAGKNVVCVGNLTSTDGLANSSSRGPAEDGRIKPDVCAKGTGVYSTIDVNSYAYKTGTSMSCLV